jgi:hypothetical protein
MRPRIFIYALVVAVVTIGATFAQKQFRQYVGSQYEDFPLPQDYQQPAEWVWARLRYPQYFGGGGGGGGFGRRGGFRGGGGSWTIDYPRCDRHLLTGVRRLTRIDARSVEQVVDLDDNDVYHWPFLYAVEVGHWNLTDPQAAKLRDYLLRGGFFMVDDFHGTYEWDVFMESLRRVFPDRSVVEIADSDPIFHSVYDLERREQVPGAQYLRSGQTWERDGYEARWRGIYDDKGRLMVAICHNMDLGDAWEWSDDPYYPEKWASLAYRIGVNYIMYSMTH